MKCAPSARRDAAQTSKRGGVSTGALAGTSLTCRAERRQAGTRGQTVRACTRRACWGSRLGRADVGRGAPWLARPTGEGPAAGSAPGRDSGLGRGCRPPLGGKRAPDTEPQHFPPPPGLRLGKGVRMGTLGIFQRKLGHLGQDTSRPSRDCLSREQTPVPPDTGPLNPTSGLQGRRQGPHFVDDGTGRELADCFPAPKRLQGPAWGSSALCVTAAASACQRLDPRCPQDGPAAGLPACLHQKRHRFPSKCVDRPPSEAGAGRSPRSHQSRPILRTG